MVKCKSSAPTSLLIYTNILLSEIEKMSLDQGAMLYLITCHFTWKSADTPHTHTHTLIPLIHFIIHYSLFIFLFFFLFRAAPAGYGSPLARVLKWSCWPTPQPQQHQSHICDLCCSLQQHWILNPLSEAGDRTCILMDTSWV